MKKSEFRRGYFTNKEGKLIKLYFDEGKVYPVNYIIPLLADKEECVVELPPHIIVKIIATGFIYIDYK